MTAVNHNWRPLSLTSNEFNVQVVKDMKKTAYTNYVMQDLTKVTSSAFTPLLILDNEGC